MVFQTQLVYEICTCQNTSILFSLTITDGRTLNLTNALKSKMAFYNTTDYAKTPRFNVEMECFPAHDYARTQ